MISINTKIDISLKQGDNSINAACSAEFELSEDITHLILLGLLFSN
jgi:hypothetical protein